MKAFRLLLLLAGLALPAAAQEASVLWDSVAQPTFPGNRSANVSNLTLTRDRISITFTGGTLQFAQPVEGLVFGASFRGTGRVQVAPPNPLEAQQLRLAIRQETLDMTFTEAVLCFTDGTFDEVARQVQWADAGGVLSADLYLDRQSARENVGAELLPRLFKGVLSGDRKRTALFAADLKTNEKGWIHVRFDALEPEEITVGRWTNWGGVVRFETWLSFPAAGRKASDAYRDPLAREDFLFRGYRIDASVTSGAELSATTTVNLEHRAAGERVLVFELDSNLRVEAVRDAAGNTLPFFQPKDPRDRNQSYGDYLAVVLPQATTAGQSQALEFRYAGKRVVRQVGTGNYFCQSYGWYPTRPNSFATRTDFEMTFHSPKKFALVATGDKISEAIQGDSLITTWKSDLPLAVAGFAFGNYKLHSEKVGAVDIEIYANRDPDDVLRSAQQYFNPTLPGVSGGGRPAVGTLSPAALAGTMGQEVGNTLRLFEAYFGPYPYKRLAVTNIPYSYGQGWPMLLYLSALSFLDSTQRHALGISDQVGISDFFRAHESSHQWWGHRVGWKSYHDQWLSEGFAQFAGNLYVQFRRNPKEYLSRLRMDKQDLLQGRDLRNRPFESLGPIWMGTRLASPDAPNGYGVVVYNKGGYVVHMLRMMLFDPRSQNPEERFMNMMRTFCQTFHNKPASTEDFKAIVERYMTPAMDLEGNRRMDWFFRQYVYGTGVAQYRFRYTLEPAAEGKWKVSGAVSQSGVPAGWMDILPIYLHIGDRVARLGWINVVQPETPFEIVLTSKPEKVSLNHNEDILADIKQ